MDRSDLFSRGATPPGQQNSQLQSYATQHVPASANQIDSLFHNLSVPADHQPQPAAGYASSEPATPTMSLSDDPASSSASASASNVSTVERQSALLTLLGTVSSSAANANSRVAAAAGPPAPQQIPTPPGSSQRSGASPNNNENQGKILLEQLMSGNAPRSNYSDSLRGTIPSVGSAPSPPYITSSTGATSLRETESYLGRDMYSNQDTPRESVQRSQPPLQPQQHQPEPPSPTRKSMFDYVSPFDALASSSNVPVKKKPVPPQPASLSGSNEDSWTSVSVTSDPKRKSVENLMDQLTRGQAPQPTPAQAPPPYDPYMPSEDLSHPEQVSSRAPLPPLPKSDRPASPKDNATQRPRPRSVEPPVDKQNGSQMAMNNARREKDSSPGPRGTNWKTDNRAKGGAVVKGKTQSTPSPQAQSIVFDVSQALDDIQAPRDAVKSTAIALVRQDAVFLPGTTIGATHWVAYGMTRGRVRVISRSSGDRTLLQLPSMFLSTSSVTDMAVYGNRLAGVTSDGGFVVWELPQVITDDVPGQLLLCVPPTNDFGGLHAVKWHPKQPDTLAVASENKVYLIDLADAARTSRIQPIPQSELHRIGQMFSVASRLVAFDFDVLNFALATISEDSTLTLWNVRDKLPFWSHKVRGEEIPSSLTFVDGGIVVGRKNGTIFQLLSGTNKNVLSTIKFVNGTQEDNEMFGHVNYDTRIQTLWVANCRRDSMIAFKINADSSLVGEERCYFEQVVEFAGPKPTIHFVILTADADPSGDEALAACVAAKVPPGELALVAFSVHSSGVDQILIRKEWFDSALASTSSKFPPYSLPQITQASVLDTKSQRLPSQMPPNTIPSQNPASLIAPARLRTPPSEEIEADLNESRLAENKGNKSAKGKNVNWKDRDASGEKNAKSNEALVNETALGVALSREIRKTEENLHTRIGRLIAKEMDKQHQRLEDARAHEQAEDFNRQETILKLISTELTRNTTRVVEAAVKNEVLLSVVPALEKVTKNEVKSALNEQIGRGLADFIHQSLPIEIEKLILRPDISNHFAQLLSSNLTSIIERNIKDTIAKNIIPAFSQQSSAMHQDVLRELRAEIHGVKKELIGWQNDAFRGQESLIRDLEHSVRSLSEQVKFLSLNAPTALHHQHQGHNSPGPSTQHSQPNMNSSHLRQQNLPPVNQPPPNYNQNHASFAQQPQPPAMHQPWFSSGIAAPQASHPAAPPPPPPAPLSQRTPPAKSEEWDDTYLAVLGTQESRQLRELLSRSNPEIVMPLNAPGPLSQAVVLTLLHRLAAIVGETPPVDESFKSSLWWLQRAASTLNTNDPLISPYIPRVVPNVQQMLNTTKQRLAILPGGPQLLDAARTITDIQDTLNRKP